MDFVMKNGEAKQKIYQHVYGVLVIVYCWIRTTTTRNLANVNWITRQVISVLPVIQPKNIIYQQTLFIVLYLKYYPTIIINISLRHSKG